MHVIIITSFPLQAASYISALKRKNILSQSFSVSALPCLEEMQIECILLPHPIEKEQETDLKRKLEKMPQSLPLLCCQSNYTKLSEWRRQSVVIPDVLGLDQLAELVREIIGENHQNKVGDLEVSPFKLDRDHRKIELDSNKKPLTRKEFYLLELLMSHVGHIVSREKIIDYVWDRREYVAQNTIDVYISRLRKKVPLYKGKSPIRTIPCLGYQFIL